MKDKTKEAVIEMILDNEIETIFIDYTGKNQTSIDITLKSPESYMETLQNIPEEEINE